MKGPIILHKNYNGYYLDTVGTFYALCESATDDVVVLSNSLDVDKCVVDSELKGDVVCLH